MRGALARRLTGKWTPQTTFAEGDFRRDYFAGDRLARTLGRVAAVRETIAGSGYTLPQAALAFALAHPAVGTVIPGMRNAAQAEANGAAGELPPLPEALAVRLRAHNWRRGVWYGSK